MVEKTLHGGNARLIYGLPNIESLKHLDDDSIHCVVTSPPYWGLRDYDAENQIGLEKTSEIFVWNIVEIFRAVRRVLHPHGSLWLNIGDTYREGQLCGIPWRVALALQNDGWILRQDVIWHKPNTMPEPVKSRCVKSHEYIFLLTKESKYFFDHIGVAEDAAGGRSYNKAKTSRVLRPVPTGDGELAGGVPWDGGSKRNRRSVWSIQTKPYKGSHFATFPEEIPRVCIQASTPAGGVCNVCGAPSKPIIQKVGERVDRWGNDNAFEGYRNRTTTPVYQNVGWEKSCDCLDAELVSAIVLDPFSGSGTTGKVALSMGRRYIGLDVNEDYLDLALRRVDQYVPDEITEEEEMGQMNLFTGED